MKASSATSMAIGALSLCLECMVCLNSLLGMLSNVAQWGVRQDELTQLFTLQLESAFSNLNRATTF